MKNVVRTVILVQTIVLLRCDLILEMFSRKRIEPDQEQTYSVYAKSDANDLDDRDFSP